MHSPIIESLQIWHDPIPRSGALNMAIDQILLEHYSNTPILRFYGWENPTISFGYFQSLEVTKEHFPDEGLEFIRRATGGGSVDHRIDLTYTLIIPSSHPLANTRGAMSYKIIHTAVANSLNSIGIPCILTSSTPAPTKNSTACFTRPVAHDIINHQGEKLAGAGQKRSRKGLLHQGSVIGISDSYLWKKQFIKELTPSAISWSPEVSFSSEVSFRQITQELAKLRYASTEWSNKHP